MKRIANKNKTAVQLLEQTDDSILADCQQEAFRGPGPGGQKRNKTSNAVRLVHLPTGLSAKSAQGRSQSNNIRLALQQLRWTFALALRDVPDQSHPILKRAIVNGRLSCPTTADAPTLAAVVLDVIAEACHNLSDAASLLGVSTASLAAFITDHPVLLRHVNAKRLQIGLHPLTAARRRGSRSSF